MFDYMEHWLDSLSPSGVHSEDTPTESVLNVYYHYHARSVIRTTVYPNFLVFTAYEEIIWTCLVLL